MDVDSRRGSKVKKSVPYNKRYAELEKKAFKSTDKSVKPVAKDTNKTRRKIVKPTVQGTRSPNAGSPVYRKGKHGD